MHHHARRLGLAYRRVDLALEVLAVRHEHHHLVAPLLVHEHLEAPREALPQGRAGRGHEARRGRVEKETHGVGVEGEGYERVGLALEGHEGEAIAFEARDQAQKRRAREEEPVRGHVGGGHGAGAVEDEHHVGALAFDLLAHHAPLRAGQGEDDSREAQQHEGQTKESPALALSPDHPRPERPGHEARHAAAVAPRKEDLEAGQEGQGVEGEEPGGRGEDHAALLTPGPRAGRPREGRRPRGGRRPTRRETAGSVPRSDGRPPA